VSGNADRKARAVARVNASVAYKRHRASSGPLVCDICGWWFPSRGVCRVSVDVHHIVPAGVGGSHDFENLILLCPNHHRIAHFLFSVKTPSRAWVELGCTHAPAYDGPVTKEELVDALRYADEVHESEGAMEQSPAFVDAAVARWEAYAGETATLEGDGRSFAAVAAERLP